MEFLKHYLDLAVFLTLGAMSLLALARCFERLIFFSRVQVRRYRDRESLKLDLGHGLITIASVASNAPYVGLLGTVFGIMITFHDIGLSGQIEATTVMFGLALALKATALGLVVAIPAMIFYNALTTKAEQLLSLWTIEENRRRQHFGMRDYETV
jgi:biopolymer transport protein ExbB